MKVTLNGTDITNAFAVRENGRYEGLVTGLTVGENVLIARPEQPKRHGASSRTGTGSAVRSRSRNHPIGGPVFAGPQVTPYFCNPNVSNPPLGAAIDAQCNAPTKVELLYRNTEPTSSSPTTRPTRRRRRRSSRRRPTPGRRCPSSSSASRGLPIAASTRWRCWSTRASRSSRGRPTSRGATSSSTRSAARAGPSTPRPRRAACSRRRSSALGFAVATSSLNIYANNCNDVVSAEATMMTKEIVVERYGQLRLHDGQRRLGGVDAAAPARRELPRPARRADDEPGLPRPHGVR